VGPLTEAIAATLGDRVQLGAVVHELVEKPNSVVVRYRQNGQDLEVEARNAVLATTANVAHEIGVNLPEDLRSALGEIKYGPYVVSAFLTNETTPQPWDDVYAIACPKRSFAIALNQASVIRGSEKERQPGGSFMTFSPAALGSALLDKTDAEVIAIHQEDLDEVLDGRLAKHVVEAQSKQWAVGGPYCFPGRGGLQPTLMRGSARVFLAGDYLGTQYTESSIMSGFAAATQVGSMLGTDHQHGLIVR
jgi:protoporphyrinogen/coproporphyrinogen III oxidase